MHKLINKTVIAMMAAVMSLSVPAVAMADNAHFTFTNLQEDQPDLYIYKSAASALDGYTVPDADFTFVLKWDQDGDGYLEFADSASYFVYDATGSQVMNENTSDGSFKTNSTGRFTLKAGQYARFEWAGQVEYEITELETEDFTQTKPAGGTSASGTIPAEGTIVDFENTYVPTDTGGGGGETAYTMVAVRKDISWIDGYEVPDLEEEFTFTIKIDGELYTNQPYGIYDTAMTEQLGSDTTDSDGQFTIKGGQTAVFEDIEAGVDYEITELDGSAGWQAVGNTFYGGSTTSPIVYTYFANEATYLVVEKERSDGVTGLDEEFLFVLTDRDGDALIGRTYYVYDADGNLIDGPLTTNGNGYFYLKAGERALFTGIAAGTEYKVYERSGGDAGIIELNGGIMTLDDDDDDREEGSPPPPGEDDDDDRHTDPDDDNDEAPPPPGDDDDDDPPPSYDTHYTVSPADGYEGTVSFGSTDTDVFVNSQLSNIAIKKFERNASNNVLEGAEFTLYKLNGETGEYEQYGDPLTTDEDGILTFTDLPEGSYKITETGVPEGYVAYGDDIYIDLPYTMTESDIIDGRIDTEADAFEGLYSNRDGVYYFYDLTYDVYNTRALLEMPNTGGWARLVIVCICVGAAAVAAGAFTYRKSAQKAAAGKERDEE